VYPVKNLFPIKGCHPERREGQEACHPERSEGSPGGDASHSLGMTSKKGISRCSLASLGTPRNDKEEVPRNDRKKVSHIRR